MRYLRNKDDGTIYEWHRILAQNPKCVEVSEEEAFPERFVPAKQRGRKSKLKLDTEAEVIDEADKKVTQAGEALGKDASTGLKS